jgi:hypothetical protein
MEKALRDTVNSNSQERLLYIVYQSVKVTVCPCVNKWFCPFDYVRLNDLESSIQSQKGLRPVGRTDPGLSSLKFFSFLFGGIAVSDP